MALAASTTVAKATLAGVAAAATSTVAGSPSPSDDGGECQLLGPFSIIIQGALGGLALLSLVYKRWRERPQRPLKIWTFDVSKQVVGSMLLHLVNLLMSMLSSGSLTVKPGQVEANPCSFYLLNLAIDTTIGVAILIVLLRVLTALALRTPFAQPPESIRSGNYGNPPSAKWWLKQSLIYFIGLFGMKLCVFFIFKICPWIVNIGDWALGWTEGNEVLQIIFVMLLFPVIMNAMQYYIVDSFIKNKEDPEDHAEHEAVPTEDPDDDERTHFAAARAASFDSDQDEDGLKKNVSFELKTSPSGGVRKPRTSEDDAPSGSTSDSAGGREPQS